MCLSASRIFSIPFIKASGLNEILLIPVSTKNFANDGISLGACPQRPTFIWLLLAARMVSIKETILAATRNHIKVGLCGQAPSDIPSFAKFLVETGISSISFNPDALIKGIENILDAERHAKNII